MNNPHKQFPGKMDKSTKKEYKKGYKVAKHGNVKEGYGKLKHVKLFESFDSQNEAVSPDVAALVIKDFKTLSKEERDKVLKLTPKEKEAIKLDNGYKWFQAQEGNQKFKFLAKDMKDAEAAAEMWHAKVLGEVSEDMEFEDTPMEEAGKADHPFVDEDMYEAIAAILNAYDNMPELQSKIEQFFAKYNVNNGQDTVDVVKDALKSKMYAKDAQDFAAELGLNLDELDESTVNEGSYTDFLTSYGNDLKKAVTQIKEISAIYDDVIEDRADEIEKAMSVYDEEVGNQIDRWTGDSNISTDKIAKFAIENQDRTGTEPKMVLDAITDFYDIIKRKMRRIRPYNEA